MTCYQLTFAYDGTEFHGWQNQPGCRTVQETIETLLRSLLQDDTIHLTGCSRTDHGVHALRMTASFRTANPEITGQALYTLLDRAFPHDIRILSVRRRPEAWNAHSAVCGKSYLYAVHPAGCSLFLKKRVWSWTEPADIGCLRQVLALFAGEHDFRNFTGEKPGVSSTVRILWKTELHEFGSILCFYFAGNGFLNKMVRRIMGVIHEVNAGKLSISQVREMLSEPDFQPCPEAVAPPDGLYLNNVFFAPEDRDTDVVTEPPFLL